jgi:hypothetical protein
MPSPGAELLRYFSAEHLPEDLRPFSQECGDLARSMHDRLGESPETTVGLRKLLEAKDCFVRARLAQR